MSKGRTKAMRLCPENCIYRNREARFCGYCLIDIIDNIKKKEDVNGNQQDETKDTDKAQRQGI